MRRALYVVIAALSVAVGAIVPTRAPVADAAIPEVQACIAQPVLLTGSYGSGVLCLQFALIIEGYSVPYTGIFGPETEDAVRWFQASHPPLVANGAAGEDTLEALGIAGRAAIFVPAGAFGTAPLEASNQAASSGRPQRTRCVADATLSNGSRGQSVICLQQRLIELGYDGVTTSGTYDIATQNAVRDYQAATPPLGPDGIGGPRTLAALDIWSGMTAGPGRAIGPGPFPAPMQEEPQWRLTAEGIPAYGNRQACTPEQAAIIAAEFANDGADAATQQWAVYIASREGGCRHEAVNFNPRTRDDSHCTYQLNVLSGTFAPTGELGRRGWTADNVKVSLQACADAASDLWVFCGRGPWIPPYSCSPPWAGATVNQPPALLPAPPDTVVPSPPADPVASAPPAADPSVQTTPPSTVAPIDTTAPTIVP